MGKTERTNLIKKLEDERKSKVICYLTSDRPNNLRLQGIIMDDATEHLYKQLQSIGKSERLDLFLYTRGGSTETAYRIVKLFREYTKQFSVIVPFRAHSAGTQIAIGADKIVMPELAELGPVDPTTGSEFNPVDPFTKGRRIPISVEDVKSFLKLAEERAGLIQEPEKLETFKILASRYEPLALGNVNRVYEEIRTLVHKLLATHMDETNDKAKIDEILKALTETYTHEHPITRDEAEKIGLAVERPLDAESKVIMELFGEYEHDLKLNDPLDAQTILGTNAKASATFDAAMIESYKSGVMHRAEVDLLAPTPSAGGQPTQIAEIGVKLKMGKWVPIQ